MSATTSFYVTGGTLRQDAPSYVERQADRDLLEGLNRGDFCYVLTSRQMGKSSLMNRTAARLRETSVAVVVLDLTAVGQNLLVEQWYDGLLGRLGRSLDLEEEVEEYWLAHERQSPLVRWMDALQQIVLPRCSGRLVIFIDEIDAVRSLPFSTDEFFAAIRECYNRRTEDPEFSRLTFCLLGVATPSDLIHDTRTTPFNVGKRIELFDFTAAEAAPLAQGLGREGPTGASLLQRVLDWTGGHPYLTQRLCQAVAADGSVMDSGGVDRHCQALFFSHGAQERDDNLLFVRERLLKSEADRASVLDLYARVRRGRRVTPDDTNPLVGILRLSGITRMADGRLRVRNRIYERVFDRNWVIQHMPDAEVRRQRAAYLQGLLRAGVVSALILAVVGGLALTAMTQARRARRATLREAQQRHLAQQGQTTFRHHLYASQMNLAQQAWEQGDLERAQALLEAWRPGPRQEELRSFEWRYLWRLCQGDALYTFPEQPDWLSSVLFSPDGKLLATCGIDPTIRFWDVRTKRLVAALRGHNQWVNRIAFSPDGKLLASASDDETVRLWDVPGRRAVAVLKGFKRQAWRVQFSPDGRTLAVGGGDRRLTLWDVRTRRQMASLTGHRGAVSAVVFSPDGRTVATGGWDDVVRIWDLRTRRAVTTISGQTQSFFSLAYSPDGKTLALGSADGPVKLWDVAAMRVVAALWGHQNRISELVFSPDGKTLATGSVDSTIRLWDVDARREAAILRGHRGGVDGVAFSPDGKLLASASGDKTVKLWDPAAKEADRMVLKQEAPVSALAYSPDGQLLATGMGNGRIQLWEIDGLGGRPRSITTLPAHRYAVGKVIFSGDGKLLASTSLLLTNGPKCPVEIKLWDVVARRWIATLRGTAPDNASKTVAFSRDSSLLALPSGTSVVLWSLARRQQIAVLSGHKDGIWALAFSPDGKTLAVNDGDTLKLWEVGPQGRHPPHPITLRGSPTLVPLLFSPDGKFLVTSGGDGSLLKMWDWSQKRSIATLQRPAVAGWEAAFAADGKTLAVSNGSSIELWNLTVRQLAATLNGHKGAVNGVAFSPDGNTLASAGGDGTVRFWRAASFEEADRLHGIRSEGGSRSVRLEWGWLPAVLGYNVYRGPSGARPDSLIKLNPRPIDTTRFTDSDPGLVNGRPMTYAVAPVYRGHERSAPSSAGYPSAARVPGGGREAEGPRVTLQAAPVAAPAGLVGGSIGESLRAGSVDFDAATGRITLRGSGRDNHRAADRLYFLYRPVAGDFRVTVQILARPKALHHWARAGLMVRESLEEGARHAALVLHGAENFQSEWRPIPNQDVYGQEVLRRAAVKLPMTLRLTRRGDTLTAEYSLDHGRSFRPAGDPMQFDAPLPNSVYVGLPITSYDESQVCEARFRDLRIEPLGH